MLLVVEAFQGMTPRFADRLLQPEQASFAANLKVTNGDLRGFRSTLPVAPVPPGITARRAKKFYAGDSEEPVWWFSSDPDAEALASPLARDAFDRVYITAPSHPPRLTTVSDIAAGNPPRILGLDRPLGAVGIGAAGGSGALDTRAYLIVYVSVYGEESAPSEPSIATSFANATWTVYLPAVNEPNTVWVDIYRSATGQQSSGNFYKVGRVAANVFSFVDTMAADLVPLQLELLARDNTPPPNDLQGIVEHSSGALVGFYGRTVHFSKPYLPHAWPESYRYPVPYQVVGLAAVSNAIIVLTKGHPIILIGDDPSTVSPVDIADIEPCLSGRSIVVIDNRAYYASPTGICTVGLDGLGRPTYSIVTKEDWDEYQPENIMAVKYGPWYLGFFSEDRGFALPLPPYDPPSLVVLDRYDQITGLELDDRSGEVYLISNGVVVQFDADDDARFQVTWRSKEWIMPKPINFGAFQIIFKSREASATEIAQQAAAIAYNAARFAETHLDALGTSPINGPRASGTPFPTLSSIVPPPRCSIGGGPLYEPDQFVQSPQVRFTLIADGVVRYNGQISDQEIHRLPSGFKATHYYFELTGNAEVQKVVVGETVRECRQA